MVVGVFVLTATVSGELCQSAPRMGLETYCEVNSSTPDHEGLTSAKYKLQVAISPRIGRKWLL